MIEAIRGGVLHREALLLRGPAGLTLEASWVPPLPFYVETVLGIFNGDNEEAFGRGSLKAPLVTGRVRTFWALPPRHRRTGR